MAAAGPGEARADAVATVPVHAARVHLREDALGPLPVRGIDAGRQAVGRVSREMHQPEKAERDGEDEGDAKFACGGEQITPPPGQGR